MTPARWAAILILLCIGAPAAAAPVDPRYVGHWRLAWSDAAGPWTIDFEVTADGTYTSRTVGPGTNATDSGAIQAADGRMSWKSARTPATDAGVYRFDEDGSLIATGSSGIVARWTRVAADGPRGSMIDPAVVGTWTREVSLNGKSYTMYMRLDGDAQYRSWAEGAHEMNGESGQALTQDGMRVGRINGPFCLVDGRGRWPLGWMTLVHGGAGG